MPSCSRVYRNNHAIMRADRVREKGSKRDKKIINVFCVRITFVSRNHARESRFRGTVIAIDSTFISSPQRNKN